MVPPEAGCTAALQSSNAFCSGCEAGTQCDIFSSKVFSCASAGVTLAASSNAKNVFLIDIVSPSLTQGFNGPLQVLLYDIIIIATRAATSAAPHVQAYSNGGSKYCGQKWQSLAQGRRDCCWGNCSTFTVSTTSF